MINNLEEYFEDQQQFFLDKIRYDRMEEDDSGEEVSLNCSDILKCDVTDEGITLSVTRKLQFDPEKIFGLEVTFGVKLKFNEKAKAVDWEKYDLPDEFTRNGQFALQNPLSRISLLVSQITSSFGQMPLVTPPGIGVSFE